MPTEKNNIPDQRVWKKFEPQKLAHHPSSKKIILFFLLLEQKVHVNLAKPRASLYLSR